MSTSDKVATREALARETLLEIGREPEIILGAIIDATALDLNELGALVQRSGYTIRRWRGQQRDAEIPASAICAIEDLRSIIAMLIEAQYGKGTITSFLRSRNAGLGRDRPLDGLRSDIGEFARVEHITQCFIEGFTPEQGRHVIERSRAALSVGPEDHSDEPSSRLGPGSPSVPPSPRPDREFDRACV